MSSVTAEVQLYFQTSDPKFVKTVNKIRFDYDIDNSAAIIELLKPVYNVGYDDGRSDMQDEQ